MPNATSFSWLVAILLIGLGFVLKRNAEQQKEVTIQYSGSGTETWLDLGMTSSVHVKDHTEECGSKATCTIQVRWDHPETMLKDIAMFYTTGPYYQNYNNYIKSEVPKELMGREFPEKLRAQHCPKISREDHDGNAIVPCGMKAFSLFNDTFKVKGHKINKGPPDWNTPGWPSDIIRYNNPADYRKRAETTWLYQRFPDIVDEHDGVKDGDFVEWMRPCALWRVWNRYGTLKQEDPDAVLKQGEELTITIQNNYPYDKGGYKHLVLTTVGHFGGARQDFNYMLMSAGVVCILLGFGAWLLQRSRKADSRSSGDYSPLSGSQGPPGVGPLLNGYSAAG